MSVAESLHSKIVTSFKSIPVNEKSFQKYLGYGSTVGNIAGLLGNAIETSGKAMPILTKTLGRFSVLGTAAGIMKDLTEILMTDYKTEKAVELFGFVNSDDREIALKKAITAQAIMGDFIEQGIVDMQSDEDGNEELIWKNENAFHEFRELMTYGFGEVPQKEGFENSSLIEKGKNSE